MKNVIVLLSVLYFFPAIVFTQHRCFTPELISSASAQSSLQKYGKRFTQFPHRIFHDTSQSQTFFVRNLFNQSRWDTMIAVRIFSSIQVTVWLDTSLVQNFFTKEEKDSLIVSFKKNLLESTSSYSINSSKGILDLEHEYFGLPPNVDGDGVLDILLLDIKDGYPSSGSYIAGFFDPNDLNDLPFSNKRDLLYIDVYPLIKEGSRFTPEPAVSTIAHEYQHLIHAHYEENESEYVFINEGLSEFAEIFCGFTPRSEEKYAQHPNRSLLSWNYSDPIPDYSRASLWTEYLFEQIGYQYVKQFVQSPKVGINAINEILSRSTYLSFHQIFTNWTLANFINDSSYSLTYSYKHPLRKGFHLQPQYSNDTLPSVNSVVVPNSSCYVVEYPFVEQLILESQQNSNLCFSAQVVYPSGAVSYFPNLVQDKIIVSTPPKSNATARVLITNSFDTQKETDTSGISFSYIARGKKAGRSQQCSYDDGIADLFSGNARYLLVDSLGAVGISVSHAQAAWLKNISVKCLFLSEVQGSSIPQQSERDMNVQIFSLKNGFPSLPLTEKKLHTFQRSYGVLDFEKISLDEFYSQLSALQDTFCIVLSNDTNDPNLFAIGLDNSKPTHSFIFERDTLLLMDKWISFKEKSIGDTLLSHWNIMVRSNSIVPVTQHAERNVSAFVTVEPPSVIIKMNIPFVPDTTLSRCVVQTPSGLLRTSSLTANGSTFFFQVPYDIIGTYRFVLSIYSSVTDQVYDTTFSYNFSPQHIFSVGHNFPNPFNAVTTVPIKSFETGEVVVNVFNVLGQCVWSDKLTLAAGSHQIPLDLSRLSSAAYFVTLNFRSNQSAVATTTVAKILMLK